MGLWLTCRASNASPRVSTAHRMRAFLLASATTAHSFHVASRSARVTPAPIKRSGHCGGARSSPPTAAEALTGPMPINVAAARTSALSARCAAMRSSHQAR